MLGHDQGFERATAVAGDVDSEQVGIGDEGLGAATVAMAGGLFGLVLSRRIAQIQAHLGIQCALDNRAFKAGGEVVDFAASPRRADQHVKRGLHLGRQGWRAARIDDGLLNHGKFLGFGSLLGHISFLSRTDEYASHTKILTGSVTPISSDCVGFYHSEQAFDLCAILKKF